MFMKTLDRESYLKMIDVIIKEYLDTPEKERSLTKLGRKYGVKRQTIAKYLKERNIDVINYQNRCRIDETVFDTIDTEEKAYWLGFLYADGNISKEGHRLEVNLSMKDLDHLLKLKSFLKGDDLEIRIDTNKGEQYPMCRMSVRNEHLWNSLNDKGCVPCKSLILKWPHESIFTKKQLIRHFVRGYWDGDGTIGLYRGKYGIIFNFCVMGTYMFLKGVKDFIGFDGTLKNASTPSEPNNAWLLQYSSLKSRKAARLLYQNANIYLERKYNIYQEFCRVEEESSTLQSSKIGESWDADPEVISEITKGSETL